MDTKRTAVALGLFDGVHLGHRTVLGLAAMQVQNGLEPAVFTFEPDAVLRKSSGGDGFIYTREEKLRLLSGCGFKTVCSRYFSEICDLSGEEFAKNIIADEMRAGAVCCGNDFRFGRGASCGVDELRRFGDKFGFAVYSAEDVKLGGVTVSSGEIRKCLTAGDVRQAELFLDRPYTLDKEVVHGAALGRTIGFPTANQLFEEGQLVPRCGVYASETLIGDTSYPSMTNIGIKPTVSYGGAPLAETYIGGFDGDIYGRRIQVRLRRFIRPEEKFASLDELKAKIAEDINIALG